MRRLMLILTGALALGCSNDGADTPPDTPGPEPEKPGPDCVDCQPDPPVEQSSEALTPIIGGTLAVSEDGAVAVVADPQKHQIFVVDLEKQAVRGVVSVAGGEPGRIAMSSDRAYVALRTGGLSVIDVETGSALDRWETCAAPRGVALTEGRVHVACVGGDLLSYDREGTLKRRVPVAPDLRDVVPSGDRLLVTGFRSATVYVVEGDAVVDTWRPSADRPEDGAVVGTEPTVAWRAIPSGEGGVTVLHQRVQTSRVVVTEEGGYGSGDGRCSRSIVTPAVTVFDADGGIVQEGQLPMVVLGVDVARNGDALLLAAPGLKTGAVQALNLSDVETRCWRTASAWHESELGFTAVAFGAGQGWALSDAPLALHQVGGNARIELRAGLKDEGRDLFHHNAGRGIACASCHPEGGDDGHTWLFEGFGLRRTQNLRGGLVGREPFHWEGDLPDMEALVAEVMVKRMGSDPLNAKQVEGLLAWIDGQPALTVDRAAPLDAIERGRALYEDPAVGCAGCHLADGSGDVKTYDVGTGGYFQVPSLLGVASRPPYLHDGCAPTLIDRFGPCGGGDEHGRTSHLAADQIDDLVAFLSTL